MSDFMQPPDPPEYTPEEYMNMVESENIKLKATIEKLTLEAKTLVDAVREEGGWGSDVMDAMQAISPEKFVEIKPTTESKGEGS